MTLLSLASWFTIEARDFENIRFDAAARGTLRDVILAVCFGIVLATLYGAYQRRVAGAPLRALLQKGALSKESAVTLAELGLDGNIFILWELRKNQSLRRLVRAVAQEPAESGRPAKNGQFSAESGAAEPTVGEEITPATENEGDVALPQGEASAAAAVGETTNGATKIPRPESENAANDVIGASADRTAQIAVPASERAANEAATTTAAEEGISTSADASTTAAPEGVELPRTTVELLDARLFIPEALKYRAELRFSKEGTGPVGIAVTVGLTVVLAVLLIKLMPAILGVVDKFL